MVKIRIYHPLEKRRMKILFREGTRRRKARRFCEEILKKFPQKPISVTAASRETKVTRETAKNYLEDMEANSLVMSIEVGPPPRKAYLVTGNSLVETVEKLIRANPGCLTRLGELVARSLEDILPNFPSELDLSFARANT